MSSAFHTLSMGAGRMKDPTGVFQRPKSAKESATTSSGAVAGPSKAPVVTSLPPELDFFGGGGKEKQQASTPSDESNKKRKRNEAAANQASASSPASLPPLDASTLHPFLRKYRLNVTGTDPPMPLLSWFEATARYGVPDWIVSELSQKRAWELTPVQRASLPMALERRDLMAMAPTGSGKTMAFLVAMLHRLLQPIDSARDMNGKKKKKGGKDRQAEEGGNQEAKHGPRALILSPTRELATQIYDETRRLLSVCPTPAQGEQGSAKRKGGAARNASGETTLRVALLTGAEKIKPLTEKDDREAGGRGAKFDIVIATPLRLMQAIEQEGWSLSQVTQVVLDEADTLLGEAFLSQTDELLSRCTAPSIQRSLFSATLPSSIEALARTLLSPDACRLIVGSKDTSSEDVDQSLRFCGSEEGKLLELRTMLKTGQVKPPTLLFVQSIERAKDLYSELVYDGLRIDVVHSDRSRTEREGVISAFRRGQVWVLICTEVLSRGLDFKGVELVINYDFPLSVESYIHRVGRTGRAGRKGQAVTFFTTDDAPYLRKVVNLLKSRWSGAGVEEMVKRVPAYLLEMPKDKKKRKESKRAKRPAPVQRQGISDASGSRMLEVDREERKKGERLVNRKEMRQRGKAQANGDKKQKQQSKAAPRNSDEDDSDGGEVSDMSDGGDSDE
ncbi:unnamed protein product [Jaminaea pallidilutea]